MNKITKIIFCLIVILSMAICDKSISQEIVKVLKMYQDSNYNKDVRPDYGGQPVIVNISIHIKDISSVSEVDMVCNLLQDYSPFWYSSWLLKDFTADFFLRQTWNDERLAFNTTTGLKQLIVGAEFIKKIWIPDTYFVNSKQTALHTSTNLETNSFLRIKPNGDVYYSLRVTVVAVCQMDLQYFPMDSQICNLEIESYGYSTEEVDYFWFEPKGTTLDSGISLPNFNIVGNYSRLQYRLVFSRSMGYYINQVYIPAILIVIISWIPFWLDRDDSHARVGLGVTTVLTMTTLVTNTNAAMPKISYMKSLDIYLEVCFAMVFASLLQYAIVGYFTAMSGSKPTEKETENTNINKSLNIHSKRNPSKIDIQSRWVFPSTFILFNLCYWTIYLVLSRINFYNHIN